MNQRLLFKPLSCTCNSCRDHFKCFNKPGCRDSKRKYKSNKNPMRNTEFKRWVKSLRRWNPLQKEVPDLHSISYTD